MRKSVDQSLFFLVVEWSAKLALKPLPLKFSWTCGYIPTIV